MKRIVILGSGFGGLRAALKLERGLRRFGLTSHYEIILIDRNAYHTFTPLLYKIATTSKETANLNDLFTLVARPLSSLLLGKHIQFLQKEIVGIDPIKKLLRAKDNTEIHADYMLFAAGSEINYFNIPGLKNHALPFKTFFDAVRVRETILNLIDENSDVIEIVIGGGGSTGAELAAELTLWCKNITNETKCRIHITIVEAAPSVLSGFSPWVSKKAAVRLRKLGVRISSGSAITNVEKNKVALKSGSEIPFNLFIWTGGVKTSSLLSTTSPEAEQGALRGAAKNDTCLSVRDDLLITPGLYAIGDAVCFYNPVTKQPIPGVARAAITQADIVAYNILQDIKKESGMVKNSDHKTFHPWSYPYVIPIGGKYAIAKIGPFAISGFFAWTTKYLVELNYFFSIMSVTNALRLWFKELWIFSKNDRA